MPIFSHINSASVVECHCLSLPRPLLQLPVIYVKDAYILESVYEDSARYLCYIPCENETR